MSLWVSVPPNTEPGSVSGPGGVDRNALGLTGRCCRPPVVKVATGTDAGSTFTMTSSAYMKSGFTVAAYAGKACVADRRGRRRVVREAERGGLRDLGLRRPHIA
jgi:hypothetical protein